MSFIEQLQAQSASLIQSSAEREAAWNAFITHGMPTRRTENWRYTTLRMLDQIDFSQQSDNTISVPELPFDACKLVFVDGVLSDEHSVIPALKGLNISTDITVSKNNLSVKKHPLTKLHAAVCEQGIRIHVAANHHIDQPIVCMHLSTGKPSVHFKHEIILEAGAKADVLMQYVGESDVKHFVNVVNDIDLHDNSALTLTTIQYQPAQTIHVDGTHINQSTASSFEAFVMSLGGKISRFDINTTFNGEHAQAAMTGVYQVRDKQHTDFHLNAEHVAPHCQTMQSVKGIAADKSKAVVNVRVAVHENACKSVSEQSNHNLLMSSTAEVDTKPELEIYNDDVKAAHGATVGQLDDDALFYLQARGLSREQAESVLRFAFVNAQFEHIKHQAIKNFMMNTFVQVQDNPSAIREFIA